MRILFVHSHTLFTRTTLPLALEFLAAGHEVAYLRNHPRFRPWPRVVAYRGKPAIRRILPLSLTFDHRVVTGGEAARFIAALVADLESEEREVNGS